jgi:TRAP-type C4-dicarboxylate transport system substrate-binding protein
LNPWAEKINKQTEGRVQIKIYYGATLSSPQDAYDAAVKGLADISWGSHAMTPGRFPLTEVFQLPGLGENDADAQFILYDLWQKFPEFEAEHKNVKLLWLLGLPQYPIVSTKPVRQLEDLKGLRIRLSGEMAETFKIWGAVPIAMPITELYMGLQRKVVEAGQIPLVLIDAFKIHEVTKTLSLCPTPGGVIFIVMNERKWESLPNDIQQVLIDVTKENFLVGNTRNATKYSHDVIQKYGKTPGHEVIVLSKQERRRWRKAAEPLFDEWASKIESKGLPGKAILAELMRLTEKYNAEYPSPWMND